MYFFSVTTSFTQAWRLYQLQRGRGKTAIVKMCGRDIILRNNAIDLEVFLATFREAYHRSPLLLKHNSVIVDLGSNIGLTLIDFKHTYPKASLLGIEMNPSNFKILVKNVQNLGNCEVLNAGVWTEDGEIFYEDIDAQSFRIVPIESSNTKRMQSISMNSLFEKFDIGTVDYLKMDIEGAEYHVLGPNANREWLNRVKLLNVEHHPANDLTTRERFLQLKSYIEPLGFNVYQSAVHWASFYAINRNLW